MDGGLFYISVTAINTETKSNLLKGRVYFILTLPRHYPSLKEVWQELKAGTKQEPQRNTAYYMLSSLGSASFLI